MTQHEAMLEQLIKFLILQPNSAEGPGILVSKVQEAWLKRLKSLYPQLCIKLGRKCDEVFMEYLRLKPPRNWDLLNFGSDLPLYLREWGQAKKSEKFLAELADYEWSLYWVQNIQFESGPVTNYILNPFVRYLRFRYGIHSWWETKKNSPKLNAELIVVSKDRDENLLVFEPTLLEAAIIDTLGEMSLSLDQLVMSVVATLPGTQQIQVEVALNSLLSKAVVRGPTPSAPID